MKQEPGKIRKQRTLDAAKTLRPCCGTLSHIAESRGAFLKASNVRWQASADITKRIVRKYLSGN